MKCAYEKQKQQVSFRFAEIASSRVGHSSFQPQKLRRCTELLLTAEFRLIRKIQRIERKPYTPRGCGGGGGSAGVIRLERTPSHVHDALVSRNNLQRCGAGEIDWDENRSSIP
jgi:hypothetical protein